MTGNEGSNRKDGPAASAGNVRHDGDVMALLRDRMALLSRAERKIASHMLDHAARLHLETGASIARAAGVSEMTVGRFVRALGFANLKALKRKVEAEQPSAAESDQPPLRALDDQNLLHDRLQADLDAVAQAHALAAQQNFGPAMRAIERAATVYVVGLPAVRGLAFDLASRLLWLRPGVVFLDADQAASASLAPSTRSVLLLIEGAPFDRRARRVAAEAAAAGLPLIVLGESGDPWPWEKTGFVFQTAPACDGLMPARTGLHVMAGLVLEAVAAGLGQRARSRYQAMQEASRRIDGAWSGRDGDGWAGKG